MTNLYSKIKKLSKQGIEVWADILQYEGYYQISNLGRIRSLDRTVIANHPKYNQMKFKGKILKLGLMGQRTKYQTVVLSKDGICKTFIVHLLVLKTFYCDYSDEKECRHLDGNSFNNKLYNLIWGTSSQNINDKIKHGTYTPGAKLTVKQVKNIKSQLQNKKFGDRIKLACKYKVNPLTIDAIEHNISWRHI